MNSERRNFRGMRYIRTFDSYLSFAFVNCQDDSNILLSNYLIKQKKRSEKIEMGMSNYLRR